MLYTSPDKRDSGVFNGKLLTEKILYILSKYERHLDVHWWHLWSGVTPSNLPNLYLVSLLRQSFMSVKKFFQFEKSIHERKRHSIYHFVANFQDSCYMIPDAKFHPFKLLLKTLFILINQKPESSTQDEYCG